MAERRARSGMGARLKSALLWLAVLAALGGMGWSLVFSDHGWLVYRQEQAEFRALQAEVARLKREREALAREILRLRNDPDALEELVHRELGYVYPDEYMVLLPRRETTRPQGDARRP